MEDDFKVNENSTKMLGDYLNKNVDNLHMIIVVVNFTRDGV